MNTEPFFSFYDPQTKDVVKMVQTDEATAQANANSLIMIEGFSVPGQDYYDEATQTFKRKTVGVTSKDIKNARDSFEFLPVEVPVKGQLVAFDCDSLSQERLKEAVDYWNDITQTKVNGKIGWIVADNSTIFLSYFELSSTYNNILQALAYRRDRLFAHATLLISQLPNVTKDDLNQQNWPI